MASVEFERFQRLVELDMAVQAAQSAVVDAERAVGQAHRNRRDDEAGEHEASLRVLRVELRRLQARKGAVYEDVARHELSAVREISAAEHPRRVAESCATAVDAVVRGFVHTLMRDMHEVNSTVEMLVAFGKGLDDQHPTGPAASPPPVTILRDSSGGDSSGEYYRGVEFEGSALEFIDRCAVLDGFVETINSAMVETLAGVIEDAKREIHREKGMNELEAPCVHG